MRSPSRSPPDGRFRRFLTAGAFSLAAAGALGCRSGDRGVAAREEPDPLPSAAPSSGAAPSALPVVPAAPVAAPLLDACSDSTNCRSGVRLEFVPKLTPGRYTLVFIADGKRRECTVELAEYGQWVNPSACDFLQLEGSLKSPNGVAVTYLDAPKTLSVELRSPARRSAPVRLTPSYDAERPGKERCPSNCRHAVATIR
jgi:hypothetical protein